MICPDCMSELRRPNKRTLACGCGVRRLGNKPKMVRRPKKRLTYTGGGISCPHCGTTTCSISCD